MFFFALLYLQCIVSNDKYLSSLNMFKLLHCINLAEPCNFNFYCRVGFHGLEIEVNSYLLVLTQGGGGTAYIY